MLQPSPASSLVSESADAQQQLLDAFSLPPSSLPPSPPLALYPGAPPSKIAGAEGCGRLVLPVIFAVFPQGSQGRLGG